MRPSIRSLLPVAVAFVLLGPGPSLAVGTDTVAWNQAGFDPTHTGYNPQETVLGPETVPGLTLRWEAGLGGAAISSPVVADGMVFQTSYEHGSVKAFDTATGALVWEFRVGTDASINTPAVAGGHVFVTTWDSSVVEAVDEATGVLDWRIRTAGVVTAPPAAVVDGDLTTLFLGGGATVYAIDGSDGSVRWTQTPFAPYTVQATPAVANGVVYVIDDQPVLHAYDAVTGDEQWASGPLARTTAAPTYAVIDAGMVFVALSGHRLYAADASTGEVAWSRQVYDASQPSAANGVVYVDGRVDDHSRLLAMTEDAGERLWIATLGASTVWSFGDGASIANGVVYQVSPAGAVAAFDAATGALLWEYPVPRGWRAMPAVVDGTMYVAVGNELLAFGL